MSKNVLIISSTLRKNGNSEVLAREFAKGAQESGNNVEFISLQDKEIKFCKGCLACQKLGSCVIKDDSNAIVEKWKKLMLLLLQALSTTMKCQVSLKPCLTEAIRCFLLITNSEISIFLQQRQTPTRTRQILRQTEFKAGLCALKKHS